MKRPGIAGQHISDFYIGLVVLSQRYLFHVMYIVPVGLYHISIWLSSPFFWQIQNSDFQKSVTLCSQWCPLFDIPDIVGDL